MKTVPVKTMKDLISHTNGKFFHVAFMKADGSLREMTCRLGVQIGVKGTGHDIKPDTPAMRVWDVNKGAFRTIPLGDRLLAANATIGGIKFELKKKERP